jgi:hypothetical protein
MTGSGHVVCAPAMSFEDCRKEGGKAFPFLQFCNPAILQSREVGMGFVRE